MRTLCCVALLCTAVSCSRSTIPVRPLSEPFTPAELQRDVDRLRSALVEGHPALTRYRSPQEIDSIFRALEDSVRAPRTALAFWTLASVAVAGIRDDHTSIAPNSGIFEALYVSPGASLPHRLGIVDGRFYLLRNYAGDPGLDGSEILAINGLGAADFLEACTRIVPTDGVVALRAARKVERDFEETCALVHGLPSEYHLRVRTPAGGMRDLKVKAVPWRERRILLRAHAPQDSVREPPAQLSFVDDSSIAILALPRGFTKSDDFDPGKFIDASFHAIRSAGTRALVIDVRGNTGGTDRYAGALFAHIARDSFTYYTHRYVNKRRYDLLKGTDDWMLNYMFLLRFHWFRKRPDGKFALRLPLDKPMSPHAGAFTGEVYLLMDGNSVSTSSEFASVFKARRRGTIVGEESGSALVGGTGAVVTVVLPSTRLALNLPLMTAYIAPRTGSPDVPARGVMPDVIVMPTLADRLQGRDPALDSALALARARAR